MPELMALDIDAVRISPQQALTDEIVAAFSAARDAQPVTADPAWNSEGLVNGFWHGRAGIAHEPVTSALV